MFELLAPAGNAERLETALYFGADAVYLSYKKFGLRAFADNFDSDELAKAIARVHELGKRVYVTLNIFARESDFGELIDFLGEMERLKPDGAIVSDLGVAAVAKKYAPSVPLHLSTQANLMNKYAAAEYVRFGFSRLVLARETSLDEIKAIRDYIPADVELEAFAHGAMCISYSGRCLLSSYLTGRSGNRGECAQSCRWEYFLREKSRSDELEVQEDERGSYILNSKDLNMLAYLDRLADAGVTSFKLEGRVKTAYYVASVVNAYRRALDILEEGKPYEPSDELLRELDKPSHRMYTTGFYLGEQNSAQCYETSKPDAPYDFIAAVLDGGDGCAVIEMRNRFKVGDVLEVLSPSSSHNALITVGRMENEDGEIVVDAFLVKQRLKLFTDVKLSCGDMLRRKRG